MEERDDKNKKHYRLCRCSWALCHPPARMSVSWRQSLSLQDVFLVTSWREADWRKSGTLSIDHTHAIKILIIARFKVCMRRLKVSWNISDGKIKIPLISSRQNIWDFLLTRIHFMEGIPQALTDRLESQVWTGCGQIMNIEIFYNKTRKILSIISKSTIVHQLTSVIPSPASPLTHPGPGAVT